MFKSIASNRSQNLRNAEQSSLPNAKSKGQIKREIIAEELH